MRCPACGGENPDGKRFCEDCGGPLAAACVAACGAQLGPDKRFCGDCGAPVGGAGRLGLAPMLPRVPYRPPVVKTRARPASGASARCCSSTSSGSRRSPRNATPRRSESCSPSTSSAPRRSSATTAGTVEKFIGDAVMAVWGAPVANEDDAERAVRAALEVVASVAELGDEAGVELAARGGRGHRRGRDHDRQGGRGHGARRHRQRRLEGAERRPARDRARRRGRPGAPPRGRSPSPRSAPST